jgi:hypothetical protein
MSSKIQIHEKAGEHAPKIKIKLPPYRGITAAPRDRHKVLPVWATTTLALIGFLAIAAFIADVYIVSKRAATIAPPARTPADLLLAVTAATNRYHDPQGRFSIAVPQGWTARFGGTNVEYDAKLEGPERLILYVIVGEAPGETIENLKKTFADTEQETGRMTHIEDVKFHDRPAIRRFCRMDIDALRSLDFLVGETSFHLMGIIPREKFETHTPIIDALMETAWPELKH